MNKKMKLISMILVVLVASAFAAGCGGSLPARNHCWLCGGRRIPRAAACKQSHAGKDGQGNTDRFPHHFLSFQQSLNTVL